MKIIIEPHGDQFNVSLASGEGKQPFITIKGCRLVDGAKGQFVSWPARKLDSGKWWNHVYASDGFQAAVVAEVNKVQPAKARRAETADDDVPF